MTAPAPLSVVTVEHAGNVTFVRWHPVELPSGIPGEGGSARRVYLRRLARHLTRERAVVGGFLLAGPLCMALQAMGVGQ